MQNCKETKEAKQPKRRQMTVATLNQGVVKAEYAVYGPVPTLAEKIRAEMNEGKSTVKRPFEEVVNCNVGNPQGLGQKPLTFIRQVMCMCNYPEILDMGIPFPKDMVARAQRYLKGMKGGIGAYTNSQGALCCREDCAAFISERDGFPCEAKNIYLTDGATMAVRCALQCLIRDRKDAVICPIPQYPVYSGMIEMFGGTLVGYYLDEKKNWALDEKELETRYEAAAKQGLNVRALVVINPGNPTGQCLDEKQMQRIVSFCERHTLVLLADEVYQTNIYGTIPFTSFRKVVKTMKSDLELISFHSVSKGFIGECGYRGGYIDLTNIEDDVHAVMYKLFCINVCPNTCGQVVMALMCRPPKQGEESYPLYAKERDAILESYKRRAKKVVSVMNKSTNITCNNADGAMYAFPRLHLPAKFIAEAKTKNMIADEYYCMKLLEGTGMVVVPGSGFGQEEGTFHLRTTILPSEKQIESVLAHFQEFNEKLMKEYA